MSNLLLNPGFETGDPPSNWSMINGDSLTQVSSPVHGGSYSARFIADSTTLYRRVRQSVANPGDYAGQLLTLRAWVLTSNSNVFIRLEDSAGDASSSFHTGGGDWELLEVSRTITSSPSYIYANAIWKNPGGTLTAYVDDAELEYPGGFISQVIIM